MKKSKILTMAYDIALQKAWEDVGKFNPDRIISVKFLNDEYTVDLENKKVLSLSCNAPAKDFTAILILHYLVRKFEGLPALTGEWITFKELSEIESYYPAFRSRAISPLIRKYGGRPEGILDALERLPAKKVEQGDIGIVVEAFNGVPVLITFWRGDDEFGPEVNMLFDRSITRIFCTEDVVVLGGVIASLV